MPVGQGRIEELVAASCQTGIPGQDGLLFDYHTFMIR